MFFARPFLALGLMGAFAATLFGHSDANAQQIYRIVGPDGRVTFSDKPLMQPNGNAKPAPVVSLPGAGGTATGPTLPFELRQVANRYPVTLYTSPTCAPCTAGRAMLSNRGIPFTEKSVTTNQDIEALKRIAGAPSLPFLTIGGQQIKGYSDVEWAEFLDAAGYPKTSQLPSGYAQAPAAPLVDIQAAQRPAAAQAPAPAQAESPDAAPESPPPNASGIRF